MNTKLLSGGGGGGRGRSMSPWYSSLLASYQKIVYPATDNNSPGHFITSIGVTAVSDWPAGTASAASFGQDGDNKSITYVAFGFVSLLCATFWIENQIGATNLLIRLIHRNVNTYVGGNLAVVLRFYGRSIPNGAAVTAWSALQKKIITVYNDRFWRYTDISIPLANLNQVAGQVGQIVFGRDPVDADDTLADQSISFEISSIRITYS